MNLKYESELTLNKLILFFLVNKFFIIFVTLSCLSITYIHHINVKSDHTIQMEFQVVPWNENLKLSPEQVMLVEEYLYGPELITTYVTTLLNDSNVYKEFIDINAAYKDEDIFDSMYISIDDLIIFKLLITTDTNPTLVKEIIYNYVKFVENKLIKSILFNSISYQISLNEKDIDNITANQQKLIEDDIKSIINEIKSFKFLNNLDIETKKIMLSKNLKIAEEMGYENPTKMPNNFNSSSDIFHLGSTILKNMLIDTENQTNIHTANLYKLENRLEFLKNKKLQDDILVDLSNRYNENITDLKDLEALFNSKKNDIDEMLIIYHYEKNVHIKNLNIPLLQKLITTLFLSFIISIVLIYIRNLKEIDGN